MDMLDQWNEIGTIMRSAFAAIAPNVIPVWTNRLCARAGLGGERGALAASEFDAEHYGRMAERTFASREAALFHYLTIGSQKGWEPRLGFSPKQYLQKNPDVFFAGYEPFAHYCRFGRREGRSAGEVGDAAQSADVRPPSLTEMLSRPRPKTADGAVDVVMPVYGNRTLTLCAIDSVIRSGTTVPFELIVVDDASPDAKLAHDLRILAEAGLITLVVNERNLGFVQTANRGLLLHRDRDIVLLNSDTCVFDGWLSRLMAALYSANDVATATPLSNAATILSYPITLRDNAVPPSDLGRMDRLCAALDLLPTAIPTAVGFCMAVRRRCLDQVGVFDADNFGRGYGEENDFCLRAASRGWKHVAATNVLVWHRGGGSFQAERNTRVQHAHAVLRRLHPEYHALICAFIEGDPLQAIRARLDAARVMFDPRQKVLELGALGNEGEEREEVGVRLEPEIGPFWSHHRAVVPQMPDLPNLPRLNNESPREHMSGFLRELDIQKIRIRPGPQAACAFNRRLADEGRRQGLQIVR